MQQRGPVTPPGECRGLADPEQLAGMLELWCARALCERLSPKPSLLAGKLDTLGAESRASEGEHNKAHNTRIPVSPITHAGGYRMACTIRVLMPFLLVTGAAATLLRKDTWEHVNAGNQLSLQTYSAVQLVGVDGLVDLRPKGHSLSTDIIMVSPHTAESIYIGPGLPEGASGPY